MDPLRAHEIARIRATPVEERTRQALAAMREGFALQRMVLRRRFPDANEAEIDEALRSWLHRDVRTEP